MKPSAFSSFKYRRQRAVNFDVYLIGAVAGNRAIDLGIAASNQSRNAAAAGGADDVGEIDIAPHRGAGRATRGGANN